FALTFAVLYGLASALSAFVPWRIPLAIPLDAALPFWPGAAVVYLTLLPVLSGRARGVPQDRAGADARTVRAAGSRQPAAVLRGADAGDVARVRVLPAAAGRCTGDPVCRWRVPAAVPRRGRAEPRPQLST